MDNNDEKIEGENLLRILNCAKIIEESYRKKIITKEDIRQERIELQAAYNGSEIDLALLEACVKPMKKRLDEFLKIRKYVM